MARMALGEVSLGVRQELEELLKEMPRATAHTVAALEELAVEDTAVLEPEMLRRLKCDQKRSAPLFEAIAHCGPIGDESLILVYPRDGIAALCTFDGAVLTVRSFCRYGDLAIAEQRLRAAYAGAAGE
ncbi:MAG: hypothetical protein GVY09_12650 [Gammaproteobacteria bacterium]|jgi:hypothetical protein|nr:hypothetical protein [Gammaproteobacteria bacterium]